MRKSINIMTKIRNPLSEENDLGHFLPLIVRIIDEEYIQAEILDGLTKEQAYIEDIIDEEEKELAVRITYMGRNFDGYVNFSTLKCGAWNDGIKATVD